MCDTTGCKPFAVGDTFLVIPTIDDLLDGAVLLERERSRPLPEVRRCDNNGCTSFSVVPSVSGSFLNLSDGKGYTIKLAMDNMEIIGFNRGAFVEVATLMLDVYLPRSHEPVLGARTGRVDRGSR